MKLVIFGVAAFLIGIGGTTGVMVVTAPKLPPGADSLIAAAHADTTQHANGAGAKGEHAATGAEHGSAIATDPAPPHDAAMTEVAAHGTDVAPAGEHGAGATPAGHGAEAVAASQTSEHDPVRVPPVLSRPGAANEPDPETYKQVGSILMNMKPVDAAKVMAYLNDSQIEGLLRTMSPRNAATVLSQMPPERAAALSRRLLVPAKEERP